MRLDVTMQHIRGEIPPVETIIDVVQLPEDNIELPDTELPDKQLTPSDINNTDNANSPDNRSEIADETQPDTYPGTEVRVLKCQTQELRIYLFYIKITCI